MKKRLTIFAILVMLLTFVLATSRNVRLAASEQLSHTVVQNANYGSDIVFNAAVEGEVLSAKLYYNTFGKSSKFTAVDLAAGTEGNYTATLPGNVAVVPYIYYYLVVETAAGTLTNGSAANPHRIKVAPKASYVAPQIVVTEANAVNGRRYDFIELKNNGATAIDLSKLSITVHEYIVQNGALVVGESNYKGEALMAVSAADGKTKTRITSENEVQIQPGEVFVVFIGKTAALSSEQGGLADNNASFNFQYLAEQYTGSRMGSFPVNNGDIVTYANTKMFLAVSDPYTAESAVIPDPSASYTANAYGTLWTVKYNGNEVTKAVVGMNNDGTANLKDKSTNNAFSDTSGVTSVHYSPYFVDVQFGEDTLTVQSRLTDAREVSINFGIERDLPGVEAVETVIDLSSAEEERPINLNDFLTITEGGFYRSEFDVALAVRKGEGDDTPVVDGEYTLHGAGEYTVTVTFTSQDFATFTKTIVLNALVDSVAPVLSDLEVTETPAYGDSITFSVEITDNVALSPDNVPALFYKAVGNAAYTRVALVPGENNVYSVTLENVKVGQVYYYLAAYDMVGNVGSIGTAENPQKITVTMPDQEVQQLIITEANAIRSKRAEFVEIYNNTNKPIALSDVVIKRYDYIVTNGAFTEAFINRETSYVTTLATFVNTATERSFTEITPANEVYIASGETFVVFIGDISSLASSPFYLDYVRNYYKESSFPNIDLSKLNDNVNAFIVNTSIDPSPTYSATKYGTAYAVEYRGTETSVAVIGMDNNGNFIDEASVDSSAASVGSIQYSHYRTDVTINGVTQTVQNRLSANKEAVISFNIVQPEQIPAQKFIVRPEVTLKQEAHTIYGGAGVFDLTALLEVLANGYEAGEYSISAHDGVAAIADLANYAYTTGAKTITFTVSSPENVFEAYTLTLSFNVINIPSIEAENASARLIYGQVDSINVSDFYAINAGAFADQYTVSVTSNIPLVNNAILLAGTYEITVTVRPVTAEAFPNVVKTFTIVVTADTAPSVEAEEEAVEATINGATFDVSSLFTVSTGSFDDAEVVYTVTLNGNPVSLEGTLLAANAGTYVVKARVVPATEGDFSAVEATVTLTLVKVAPTITAKDVVVQGTVVYAKEASLTTINLNDLFTVIGNSYQSSEYTLGYSVKKGQTDVTITDMTIPAAVGTYTFTITLNTNDEEHEVELEITIVVKAVPVISGENADVEGKKGMEVDLGQYVSVDPKDYQASQYTVNYSVKYFGENVQVTNGKFAPKNSGAYEVTITVSGTEFQTITKTITLNVELASSGSLLVIIISAVAVVTGGTVAFILIKRRKFA
jgi:hypothetical protein